MTAFLLPLLCAALVVALGTAPLVRRDRRRSRTTALPEPDRPAPHAVHPAPSGGPGPGEATRCAPRNTHQGCPEPGGHGDRRG